MFSAPLMHKISFFKIIYPFLSTSELEVDRKLSHSVPAVEAVTLRKADFRLRSGCYTLRKLGGDSEYGFF